MSDQNQEDKCNSFFIQPRTGSLTSAWEEDMLAAPAGLGRWVKTRQMDSVGQGVLNGSSIDTSTEERENTND